MTYFTADPNVWYSITTHVNGSDHFIVPNAYVGQDHALVNTFAFAEAVDLTGWVGVQWQFFPVTEPANVDITFLTFSMRPANLISGHLFPAEQNVRGWLVQLI
jgi:hypothetical protein